jgi:hypothetical protein
VLVLLLCCAVHTACVHVPLLQCRARGLWCSLPNDVLHLGVHAESVSVMMHGYELLLVSRSMFRKWMHPDNLSS